MNTMQANKCENSGRSASVQVQATAKTICTIHHCFSTESNN